MVSVTGEVDLATVPALERTLRAATELRTRELILDLTRCSFLDAGGLGVLSDTRARLARSNRALALVLSQPIVLKIFRDHRTRQAVRDLPVAGRGRAGGGRRHV